MNWTVPITIASQINNNSGGNNLSPGHVDSRLRSIADFPRQSEKANNIRVYNQESLSANSTPGTNSGPPTFCCGSESVRRQWTSVECNPSKGFVLSGTCGMLTADNVTCKTVDCCMTHHWMLLLLCGWGTKLATHLVIWLKVKLDRNSMAWLLGWTETSRRREITVREGEPRAVPPQPRSLFRTRNDRDQGIRDGCNSCNASAFSFSLPCQGIPAACGMVSLFLFAIDPLGTTTRFKLVCLWVLYVCVLNVVDFCFLASAVLKITATSIRFNLDLGDNLYLKHQRGISWSCRNLFPMWFTETISISGCHTRESELTGPCRARHPPSPTMHLCTRGNLFTIIICPRFQDQITTWCLGSSTQVTCPGDPPSGV